MTPEERSLLGQFLDDLDQARGVAKDPEADSLITQAFSRNPDAAYLLVQHGIVADESLHATQARIAELEQQLSSLTPAPAASSFLPRTSPWTRDPQAGYAPPPVDQRPGFFSSDSGLGSFLRNAGTTAAATADGERTVRSFLTQSVIRCATALLAIASPNVAEGLLRRIHRQLLS